MPEKKIDNERKVCDAIARSIEAGTGASRTGDFSPEDDSKSEAPVEYVFTVDGTQYALEHTVVEAFAGQIKSNVDFASFIDPIMNELDSKMPPPGLFYINFDIRPTDRMKPKAVAKAQAEIIDWIKAAALDMHAKCPETPSKAHHPFGHTANRSETVAGIKLTLRRECRHDMAERHMGRLLPARFAPADYEKLRQERLAIALAKKLPKLKYWHDIGARSILVLENRDISLSNHWSIFEATEKGLAERDDSPDEIWLVDTSVEEEWTVWRLIVDGKTWPDENTDSRYRDFKSSALAAV